MKFRQIPKEKIGVTEQSAREVRLFGIDARRYATVGKQADAEQAPFMVCATEGDYDPFPATNVHTTCAICGVGIFHRPHAPSKPQKICGRCFTLVAGGLPDG